MISAVNEVGVVGIAISVDETREVTSIKVRRTEPTRAVTVERFGALAFGVVRVLLASSRVVVAVTAIKPIRRVGHLFLTEEKDIIHGVGACVRIRLR